MAYYTVMVHPHQTEPGLWEVGAPNGDGWEDAHDLIDAMGQMLWAMIELDTAPLPDGVEDIRGRVYGEPDRLWACRWDAHSDWFYGGIVEHERPA